MNANFVIMKFDPTTWQQYSEASVVSSYARIGRPQAI
jgi:hypothetical protein